MPAWAMPRAKPPPSANPIRGADGTAEASCLRIGRWTTPDEALRLPIDTRYGAGRFSGNRRESVQQLARQRRSQTIRLHRRNVAPTPTRLALDQHSPMRRLTPDRRTSAGNRSKSVMSCRESAGSRRGLGGPLSACRGSYRGTVVNSNARSWTPIAGDATVTRTSRPARAVRRWFPQQFRRTSSNPQDFSGTPAPALG